jgi:hypothetical protein
MNKRIFVITIFLAIKLFVSSLPIDALLNLNDQKFSKALIFKCPLKSDPLHPDHIDPSIIIFKNKTISNLVQSHSVIISSDSNIMHKISYSISINDYTFSYATMAPIDYLLEYNYEMNSVTIVCPEQYLPEKLLPIQL